MNKVLAQLIIEGNSGLPDISLDEPEGFTFSGQGIGAIVGQSLTYVFAAAGIGLLLMIISSGYSLIVSAGDPKKAAAGKATLTNAIIGFLLIFAAFWIVQIMGTVLGWQSIFDIFGQ